MPLFTPARGELLRLLSIKQIYWLRLAVSGVPVKQNLGTLMEVKCCRKTGAPASLHIASWTDAVFIWRGAAWLEMRLERSVHSLTEGKPRVSWCCRRSWLWVLLISTQKECDGFSSFFMTCCHMQIFLRGVSFRHIWAVEGACLGMRARKSHTSLTRAMKDVQDTHTLPNQFLLAVGFSPLHSRSCARISWAVQFSH